MAGRGSYRSEVASCFPAAATHYDKIVWFLTEVGQPRLAIGCQLIAFLASVEHGAEARLCYREVDGEFDPSCKLHRQVAGLSPLRIRPG